MDCSPWSSSVHRILQERTLEWVVISFSRGIFPTQGSNPCLLCLLNWQAGSLPLASGKPPITCDRQQNPQCSPRLPVPPSVITAQLFRNVIAGTGGYDYEVPLHSSPFPSSRACNLSVQSLRKIAVIFIWNLMPFPSPMHESESESQVTQSCPT